MPRSFCLFKPTGNPSKVRVSLRLFSALIPNCREGQPGIAEKYKYCIYTNTNSSYSHTNKNLQIEHSHIVIWHVMCFFFKTEWIVLCQLLKMECTAADSYYILWGRSETTQKVRCNIWDLWYRLKRSQTSMIVLLGCK